MDIKDLEEELGCHLDVVHVPGTLMIGQSTDGLSRGLWASAHQREVGLNQSVFLPVPHTTSLGNWACAQLGLNPDYLHRSDLDSWES